MRKKKDQDTSLLTDEEFEQEEWDLIHLELDHRNIKIDNPFDHLTHHELSHPDEHLLSLLMKPEYFGWTCKTLFNIDLLPMQDAVLRELWYRPFPILCGSRGFSKTWSLGLYAILRALLLPGRKIVMTGAGFRQSKLIFGYAEAIWHNSPLLRDICGASHSKLQGPHHDTDLWWMQIGESKISAIPIGDGQKVRGMRAHDTLIDEYGSISVRVLEEVIEGFGVVNIEPVVAVKEGLRIQKLKEVGKWKKENQDEYDKSSMGNQTIISGTATFGFTPFGKVWKKHKAIIKSGGDPKKLMELGLDRDNINHKHFSIFRIPVELLPPNFMDEKQIQKARATKHSGIYSTEYGAVFSDDSNGFYQRSLVESCVTTNSIRGIQFSATVSGNPLSKYIYGIDPAIETDNFAVVVLEHCKDHAKIVYCWTTNREVYTQRMKEFKKTGVKSEKSESDFYMYCCRKLRDLMEVFPCIHISMDSQGGGRAISEPLHNTKYLKEGELPIWELNEGNPLWDGKQRENDGEPGLHILEMVNFADSTYYSDMHHGLRFDLEQKNILFPYFDSIEIVMAGQEDIRMGREYDTLEDCVMEIEELKSEITTIQHVPTSTGKDHWDTPQIKTPDMKKGRLHKDRFSALIMAAYAARRLRNEKPQAAYIPSGGMVGRIHTSSANGGPAGPLYIGPAWFTEAVSQMPNYGKVVPR